MVKKRKSRPRQERIIEILRKLYPGEPGDIWYHDATYGLFGSKWVRYNFSKDANTMEVTGYSQLAETYPGSDGDACFTIYQDQDGKTLILRPEPLRSC